MNKEEAIKAIEKMGEYERFVDEHISKKSVLNIINQIGEPQKVTIPKFVADWIEEYYSKQTDIFTTVTLMFNHGYSSTNVCDWANENQEKFLKAILNGYEIEKEKLYIIPLKGLITTDGHQQYLSGKVGRYFASRRNYSLKQTFTQTEVDNNVPVCYREWAKEVVE
ncbi:Protein of unknown function [Streptococcus henryi]|uniref:DUF1642 domain-containing protein n=1 Tax=Streptococcus henryi TaxID=439219 RepID=A0A1G6AK70_9STRE|nr:DUF1642 domain-containing protein [Streptococcus henryi]QBX25331.1 hypothetical protein Javan252_0030 [Streptococcus phage Javan252]SDB08811.1 Protein of unknown function [Streptococcus henryi]